MNKRVVILLGLLSLLLMACGENVKESEPAAVAEQFWDAMQRGDKVQAEQFALPESLDGGLMGFDGGGSQIDAITFTTETVSNYEAIVPTHFKGALNGRPVDVNFDTRLVQHGGAWRVDFNTTNTGMMGALLKQAVGALGGVMANGMERAAGSVNDALSESGEVLSEGMADFKAEIGKGAASLVEELNAISEALSEDN